MISLLNTTLPVIARAPARSNPRHDVEWQIVMEIASSLTIVRSSQ